MTDQHLRDTFAQKADKYGRLNLSSFLACCKTLTPQPQHHQNHCCTVAADPSLPHTQSWSKLRTNGKTAQEKRELAALVEVLRTRVDQLEPIAEQFPELSHRAQTLQQSKCELEAELHKLRAEVQAEREWLESQLHDQATSHQRQQSELRNELVTRHVEQVDHEKRTKVLLREQLLADHHATVQQLETQMALQTKSLADRVAVHIETEHKLLLELEGERRRRSELEAFIDSVDVDKLRRDCREYQAEIGVSSEKYRTETSKAYGEVSQVMRELSHARSDTVSILSENSSLKERLAARDLELVRVREELSIVHRSLKNLESQKDQEGTGPNVTRRQYTLPEGGGE